MQNNSNSCLIIATKSLPTQPIKRQTTSRRSGLNAGAHVSPVAAQDSNLMSCLECGRHFVSVAKLRSHEKTHSKSRPFKCIDCGKTFTVRYSLICHTRTHTRERPYQCSSCGSRFTQASSLKTHQIYKHTKQFPYACKQCGRGFISPGQRHEHVSRTHLKNTNANSAANTAAKKPPRNRKTIAEATPIVAVATPTMSSAACQTALSLPPILYEEMDENWNSFHLNSKTNCFLEKSLFKEDISLSVEESTLSLPSIIEQKPNQRLSSVRQTENVVEELKKENFSLKLRIYWLERNDATNHARNDFERDIKHVTDSQETARELRRKNESLAEDNRRLDVELARVSRDLLETHQLSRQLFSHLWQICGLLSSEEVNEERERRLKRLLSSSEDLLNCASVLLQTEENTTHVTANDVPHQSSDSDDIWSEPDRDVSRARIGLPADTSADSRQSLSANSRLKNKPKRRQSIGISTELLSSLSLPDFTSGHNRTESAIQTDIACFRSTDDKSVQTTADDTHDVNDDRNDRNDVHFSDAEIGEKFCEFLRTKAKPKANGQTGGAGEVRGGAEHSLYTYFASLSPVSKRTKELNFCSKLVPNLSSLSSSGSLSSETPAKSDRKSASLQTLSPDLGIGSNDEKNSLLRQLSDLKDFLIELKTLLTEDDVRDDRRTTSVAKVSSLLAKCLKICEKVEKSAEKEEKMRQKLERMRKSREMVEKLISREVNKTSELLAKTQNNLLFK